MPNGTPRSLWQPSAIQWIGREELFERERGPKEG
jgi:hypothetical protein